MGTIPAYSCPENLPKHWWKPFVTVNLIVRSSDDLDLFEKNAQSEVLDSNITNTQEGGIVSYKNTWVLVSFHLNTRHDSRENPHECFLFPDGQTGNCAIALTHQIERVLLASGAKSQSEPSGCRALYHCTPTIASTWWQLSFERNVEVSHRKMNVDQFVDPDSKIYEQGQIKQQRAIVDVFPGVGVDCNSGELTHFLSLSYKLSKANIQLAQRFGELIVHNGGQQMVITE